MTDQPEYIAPLVPTVVPIETLNKKDLYEHLSTFHSGHVGTYQGVTSKSSKTDMENLHARLHEIIDHTQAEQALVTTGEGRSTWVPNPVQAEAGNRFADGYRSKVHEHLVLVTGPASEDEREMLDAIQNGDLGRVLSVTERKALERLIDNDFASLRNEMNAYAKDVLTERLKAVEEDFTDRRKEAERLRKATVKALAKANVEVTKALETAKTAGVDISGLGNSAFAFNETHWDGTVKAVVAGQAEAETKVKNENRSDIQAALHTLERQRLASQRLVLLAGISPEGQKLLDTVPDARTLMVEAASERAAKQITAAQ